MGMSCGGFLFLGDIVYFVFGIFGSGRKWIGGLGMVVRDVISWWEVKEVWVMR